MKLLVVARGIELSAELREFVNRRIHFSLGRFAGRIRTLCVRLTDVNGPRGGVDKRCDIRIEAGFRQPVIVHERRASLEAAVATAAERAERAVVRHLQAGLAGPRAG